MDYLDKSDDSVSVTEILNVLNIPIEYGDDITALMESKGHIIKTKNGHADYIEISNDGRTFLKTSTYLQVRANEILEDARKITGDRSK